MAEQPTEAPAPATAQGNGAAPAGASVLERLRARRRELAGERHLDLAVPGYDDLLVVRYGPLSSDAYTRLAVHVSPGAPPAGSDADYVGALVEACRDVLVRESPEGWLEPIDPEGGPTRFGARLAELLELDLADPRTGERRAPRSEAEVVRALFFGEGGYIANQAVALFGFSGGAEAEIEAALAGESWGRPS